MSQSAWLIVAIVSFIIAGILYAISGKVADGRVQTIAMVFICAGLTALSASFLVLVP